MSDDVDLANDRLEFEMQIKLSALKMTKGESFRHCVECKKKIPEARRLAIAGVKFCITCASEIENKKRFFRVE